MITRKHTHKYSVQQLLSLYSGELWNNEIYIFNPYNLLERVLGTRESVIGAVRPLSSFM